MVENKYSKSIKKLEDIIDKIENEEIDVDELSDKVKEAVSLIKVCKDKIEKAELEIKKVVDFETAMLAHIKSNNADLVASIDDTGDYNDDIEASMRAALDDFKAKGIEHFIHVKSNVLETLTAFQTELGIN